MTFLFLNFEYNVYLLVSNFMHAFKSTPVSPPQPPSRFLYYIPLPTERALVE